MTRATRYSFVVLFSVIACGLASKSLAWDSVGHRLSATVAIHYLGEDSRSELLHILQQHPRYRQDFLEQMPDAVASGSEDSRLDWLLGQAAFWPDMTRGFPESERERYNRANWHYIDGAWLRGAADVQGNTYIGVAPFADVEGRSGENIRRADSVDNIMNALDYNTSLLAEPRTAPARRAVALCWVLHLVGDIHQPLHVGSLYSRNRFVNGDRGGNAVETEEGNLHARWDRALSASSIGSNFETVLERHGGTLDKMSGEIAEDWSVWMQESRALLLNTVYSEEMKRAIARGDSSARALQKFQLSDNYVQTMEYHARMRLALAGRRLALWFEANL